MRRIRRKCVEVTGDIGCRRIGSGTESGEEESGKAQAAEEVDWTSLADDTLLGLFGLLNYRDRVSVGAVCKTWYPLACSPSLWTALDLRAHTMDPDMASCLARKCQNLQRLKFRGASGANVIINLQARQLKDLCGDGCKDLTDAALSMVVARHENLECLQLGPELEKITSDAIRVVAICCPKLRCLRLAGIRDVDSEAIGSLLRFCPNLVELALLDCAAVDAAALGEASSLKYLSVAGSRNIIWSQAIQAWSKLINLVAVDVSRTEVTPAAVMSFLSLPRLRVLCALSSLQLEEGSSLLSYSKEKVVLARFTELMSGLSAISGTRQNGQEVSKQWDSRIEDGHLFRWTEWVLSHALLRIAESNTVGMDSFWLKEGTSAMLNLIKSSQEDVQERAATALATFVVVDDENATVDPPRAEAVMHGGGIRSLLDLARSSREGVQSEAAKAIANLSVNAEVAKAVAADGGIAILAGLARSPNRWVAEEAAGGLWNLSVGEEHKSAIAEAGAIEALVDLALKWPAGGEGVLERAAGALANLAADDKCSMRVANAGGVHALVRLARFCKHEGVQEQAARALANLAAHGDSNGNNAAVGREAGALEALVKLTCSTHEGVRQEAAGALWNLSFDDRNREAIAAAGGVQALVALAQGCSSGSQGLQERAAGALWGLSVSEDNSIAIGREGGVAPLIALARSDAEDVHETAAGALWNLAFNSGNALRIVEEEGVTALVRLCASSRSKMARFMAALALAYMFDGRVDEAAAFCEGVSKTGSLHIARQMAMKNIEAFVQSFSDQQLLNSVSVSQFGPTALQHVADSARIQEAGHLRCSGAEVGRFVDMLRSGPAILKACAAFALLQFTMPGGRHALHHASLLQKLGAGRVLRKAAACTTSPLQARVFARVVLRNLEQCQGSEGIK